MIGYLNGMMVFENKYLTDKVTRFKRDPRQIRRPRTQRIWKARPYHVAHVPSKKAVFDKVNNCIYVHPVVARELRGQLQSQPPVKFATSFGFRSPQ